MPTEADIFAELVAFVDSHRTQREAARALGISQPFLIDVLYKRRGLGRKIPAFFGYHITRRSTAVQITTTYGVTLKPKKKR